MLTKTHVPLAAVAPPLAVAVAGPPIAVVAVAAAEYVPRDVYRLRHVPQQRHPLWHRRLHDHSGSWEG